MGRLVSSIIRCARSHDRPFDGETKKRNATNLLTWSSSFSWRTIIWCRCIKHMSFTWRLDSWCFSWICFSSSSQSIASRVRIACRKTCESKKKFQQIDVNFNAIRWHSLPFAFVVKSFYRLWPIDRGVFRSSVAMPIHDSPTVMKGMNAPCPRAAHPWERVAYGIHPSDDPSVANRFLVSASEFLVSNCHGTRVIEMKKTTR